MKKVSIPRDFPVLFTSAVWTTLAIIRPKAESIIAAVCLFVLWVYLEYFSNKKADFFILFTYAACLLFLLAGLTLLFQ